MKKKQESDKNAFFQVYNKKMIKEMLMKKSGGIQTVDLSKSSFWISTEYILYIYSGRAV